MQCRIYPLLFLVCLSFLLPAQKKQDYRTVVNELYQKIETSATNRLPLKIAVVPFTSSSPTQQNRFGEYITESVTGKLLEKPQQFKVFERSRLDAIFKENELMVSGMMNTAEAIKIGKLLSVDALFSGTYTQLKSYVDISGRLIDVVSGEILTTYSGRIKIDKNIALLFSSPQTESTSDSNAPHLQREQSTPGNTTINIYNNSNPTNAATSTDCKIRDKEMEKRSEDLTTEEKINSLVADAIKIPFDNECGKFHYQMMGRFMRYKIQNQAYYDFLVRTLRVIPFTTRDERAQGIIEFITHDGTTEDEWKWTLEAIQKVEGYFYMFVSSAFRETNAFNDEEAKQRVDEFFRLVNDNKVGKPEPLTYNRAFFQFMQGLASRNHNLQVYMYEKYGDNIAFEESHSTNYHYLYLHRMYEKETDPTTKTKIVKWVADYFNKYPYKKSPDQLYEFANLFDPEVTSEYNKRIVEEKNQEKAINFPMRDLKLLIDLCRAKFTAYATETEYQSTKENRINFCLKYNIDVPGAIPTMDEANAILKGNDLDEQIRIMKLLVQMGEKPKLLEGTLIATQDRRSLDEKEKLKEVQNFAMEILGNIKTTSPKVINLMIANLTSFNYKESDNAQEALVKIGKPAVKPLMDRLSKTTLQEGGLQYKLVVILGRIGNEAKPSESLLRKILSEAKNADIKYAAEAALQSIN